MLPEFGFIDTQQVYSDGFYNRKFMLSFYNPYAAMPSLHFGLALLVGFLAYTFERRILRVFAVVYPAFMASVIVTTGHHFFMDVAVGGILAGFAYGTVKAFPFAVKQPASSPARMNGGFSFLDHPLPSRSTDRFYKSHPVYLSKKDQDCVLRHKLRSGVTTWFYRWRPPL